MPVDGKVKRKNGYNGGYSKIDAMGPLTESQKAEVAGHMPMVYWYAARRRPPQINMSLDEWISICSEILINCVRCFDPSRGVKFSVFFTKSVDYQWKDLARRTKGKTYSARNASGGGEEFGYLESKDLQPIEHLELTEDREIAVDIVKLLSAELFLNTKANHQESYQWAIDSFNGKTQRQIGKEAGRSKQAVQQRISLFIRAARLILKEIGVHIVTR